MTTTVPVHNARSLAAHLAEHQMPGQRSMTAIDRIRRQRNNRRPAAVAHKPATERVHGWLLAKAKTEILRRGGETVILGEKDHVSGSLYIAEREKTSRMMLLRAEGWRQYGRTGFSWVKLAYVYGVDDAGEWAVRVPGTMTTLAEALAWMEPADVRKARAAGRKVRRQGDVYAIETTKAHDGKGASTLPDAHEWRPAARSLVHRPEDGRRHKRLHLTFPVRFVQQTVLAMGRSGARSCGD